MPGTTPPGDSEEPEPEPTHLGPEIDRGVRRATAGMGRDVGPDHDLVRDHLDPLHYLLQNPPLLERPRTDLAEHFLERGQERGLDPEPDFSTRAYLERHPERSPDAVGNAYLAWLREGRARGEIADPAPAVEQMSRVLGRDPSEVVDLLVERRRDVRERLRTGELGEMVARAIEVEPLVAHARTRFTRPQMSPLGQAAEALQAAAMHGAHDQAGFRPARLVLVVNRPRWGGGRRLEGHLAHAFAERAGADAVVVVYTEEGGTAPPGRFPDGVREIDFARLVDGPDVVDAQETLALLLRSLRAEAIVNVNSKTLYRAMQEHGDELTASERIFLCLFCNEMTATGAWSGWALRYFHRLFDDAAGVITDSDFLRDELIERYRVPASARDRIRTFRAPVDGTLPFVADAPARPDRRPQMFWAGRWDRQKRVGLLLDIARQLPEVDFRMWGEPVMGRRRGALPGNVRAEGRYDHIREVPLDEADAWLYTSAWDGVPSQLLEVTMTGVPVVGTRVGGTGEVLDADGAWLVDADAGPEAYVRALREVLSGPEQAREGAAGLRARLLRDRAPERFAEQMWRFLGVAQERP